MLKIHPALIFSAYLFLNACGASTTSSTPTTVSTLAFTESNWAVISPENVSTLQLIAHLAPDASGEQPYQIVWAPNGKLLAVASSTGVYLYDVTTLQLTAIFEKGQNVVGVSFAPDSQQLALARLDGEWGADICGTTVVNMWGVSTRALLKTLKFNECDSATFLTFAQGGRELVVIFGELEANRIQIWDAVTWRLERNLNTGAGGPWNVSPDASTLMFSPFGDGVAFVDLSSGDKTYYGGLHTSSKAMSSNGLFALGSFIGMDSYLEVSDVATTEKIWSVRLNSECVRISSVTFTPGNQVLAIGCSIDWKGESGTIRLYNSSTGYFLAELDGEFIPDKGLAFSPDGRVLVSSGADGSVLFWGVPNNSQ